MKNSNILQKLQSFYLAAKNLVILFGWSIVWNYFQYFTIKQKNSFAQESKYRDIFPKKTGSWIYIGVFPHSGLILDALELDH